VVGAGSGIGAPSRTFSMTAVDSSWRSTSASQDPGFLTICSAPTRCGEHQRVLGEIGSGGTCSPPWPAFPHGAGRRRAEGELPRRATDDRRHAAAVARGGSVVAVASTAALAGPAPGDPAGTVGAHRCRAVERWQATKSRPIRCTGTSKQAVILYCKRLAGLPDKYGVRINTVSPGPVETRSCPIRAEPWAKRCSTCAAPTVGRHATVGDIAPVIRSSDPGARWITGGHPGRRWLINSMIAGRRSNSRSPTWPYRYTVRFTVPIADTCPFDDAGDQRWIAQCRTSRPMNRSTFFVTHTRLRAAATEAGVFAAASWTGPRRLLDDARADLRAVSFDAVNRVFAMARCSTRTSTTPPSASSSADDSGDGGKTHWEHRNLVSAAFKSKSLLRWNRRSFGPSSTH